jgi:hypothetical protein
MNKFFLFLAVFSLAIFTACSDDKGPCDDGPSVGCLVGTWRLDGITNGVSGNNASSETGTLKLMSEGGVEYYEFDGGASLPKPFSTTGTWGIVDGKIITITNDDVIGEATLSGTITINGDNAMNIRSATNRAIISLYGEEGLQNPIEKFTRK